MDTPVSAPKPDALTAEQWRGLATLGDLGQRLGALVDGPLGAPAAAGIERLGALDSTCDLGGLAEKLVTTVHALDRAGVLDMIRDNAQFIGDSLDTLRPLISQWLERIGELPAGELKADAAFALGALRKARIIAGFVDAKLAGELAGKLAGATEFVQSHQTDEALAEVLVQLGRIHRSGLLPRLGDLAEYVAGLDEGTNLESQLGSLVNALPANAIGHSFEVIQGAREAMADVHKDEKHLGGYAGMLHLLRDKEVQKGLRMLSVLPLYLDKQESRDGTH